LTPRGEKGIFRYIPDVGEGNGLETPRAKLGASFLSKQGTRA